MSPKRMATFIISYYFAHVYRLFSIKILENKKLFQILGETGPCTEGA